MKTHLNVATKDLETCVDFCRPLLVAEAEYDADCALFVIDDLVAELAHGS